MALNYAGQSADVVMASGLLSPEPPGGAGLVVEVEAAVVEVVEVFELPRKTSTERPTTTATATTTVMMRRTERRRFWAFCSASRRA